MPNGRTSKQIYINEKRQALLEKAREVWPNKSDSEILWGCLERALKRQKPKST